MMAQTIANFNMVNKSFQENLLASLMEDSDDEDDVCLITGERFADHLPDNRFELPCKHAFLRKALYDEVYAQKIKWKKRTAGMSHSNPYMLKYFKKLTRKQFMCPYCRKIHNHLLPQWEGFAVHDGVNSPLEYTFPSNHCVYVYTAGGKKGQQCKKFTHNVYCNTHLKRVKQPEAKQLESSANHVDYTNISHTLPPNVSIPPKTKIVHACQAILKSGKRKGQVCMSKAKFQQADVSGLEPGDMMWVCGRHKQG